MSNNSFENLDLNESIQAGINKAGFKEMTPIQAEAIPVAQSGRDILATSPTGSGKTLAFGIPALLSSDNALVLCPTRELAQQVGNEIKMVDAFNKSGIAVIIGGASYSTQKRDLSKKGKLIVIATPGRMRDHLERKTISLENFGMLVLDEADEMMSMGFAEDLNFIRSYMNQDLQVLLFSATFPKHVRKFAEKSMQDPVRIGMDGKQAPPSSIEQFVIQINKGRRPKVIEDLLKVMKPRATIVFCKTRARVEELQKAVKGVRAGVLHGGFTQNERSRCMNQFREGKLELLIATDVASRGLDVDHVDLIIHDDLPMTKEVYVHRTGRTGRAGRNGTSIIFAGSRAKNRLKQLRKSGNEIYDIQAPTKEDVDSAMLYDSVDELMQAKPNPLSEDILDALLSNGLDLHEIALRAISNAYSSSQKEQKQGTCAIIINIGKSEGANVRDVLKLATSNRVVEGEQIGKVNLLARMAVIEVPIEIANDLAQEISNRRFRNRRVRARVSEDWEFN